MNGGEAFHPYLLSTPTSGAMYAPKTFYPEVHAIPSMPQPDLYPMRPYMVRPPYSMNGFGGYMDMEQPAPMITIHDKTPRSRRRYPPGTQPTKHRRTRSGCYTCRQRRIKCDETRPICDRCRKGKRDCTYPGAAASSSSAAARSKRKASTADDASNNADNEPDETELEHEHDNEEKTDDCGTQLITPMQSFDDSAYSTQDDIATARPVVMADPRAPLMETPTAMRRDSHHPATPTSMHNTRWNKLPEDIKMLLTYYRDNLTDHHYLLRDGHGGIIKKVLLERAVNDESQALLYAVVAFATYYYTREHGDASVVNSQPGVPPFLVPQGKSIALLQKSLRHGNPDVTTLLTILQLATMEECLGDWNNMDRHRKAALGVISRLYTPQTLALDEVGRSIAAWYMQFDLFNAMISSTEVCLGREYFLACQNFCKRQTQRRPRDPKVRFADYYTTMRLIKSDLAHYLAVRSRGAATGVDLQIMAERLVFRLEEFGRELELAFPDCPIITEKNSHMPHFNPHGILDFIDPEPYYTGDLATMNYVLVDFWALDLEIKSYVEARPATELARTTLKIAGMIERMQQSVHEPASAILSTRSALSAAGFILPKQPQYFGWLRQQFAAIERLGYVYPSTFRRHIFDVWGVVDTDDAWLPTVSAEHVSPGEVDMQNFLAYRVSAAAAGPQPGSATSSFADVGGVLSTLPFDDEVFDLDFVSA